MPRLKGREIVVPASIGNLGPGLDTLGLAVSLYLRARVIRLIADGRGRLVCRFAGEPPRGQNRVQRAFAALPRPRGGMPSLEVEILSDIPQRAGLGSSAAATIAGLRLRELVDRRRSVEELLSAAYRLERHPDNAASALLGGLTSSCVMDDGRVQVARWPWPAAWRVVVATPDIQLSTADSRRALPAGVPLADAVFNLQRLARLLGAIRSGRPADLEEACRDMCHQPYREPLAPGLRRALELRHPDVMGICLSGAGPSVVAFARRNLGSVEEVLRRVYRSEHVGCTVRTLRVHQTLRVAQRGHA
jgi:homoserine kinase